VILLHDGHEPLHEAALDAGVTDISLESPARNEANAAAEMTLALGARRLDFSIDESGVSRPGGDPLREISVREAESLAGNPNVRPRIRAKLAAGVTALRKGVERVRIGDPTALARDMATVVVLDPDIPISSHERTNRDAAVPRAGVIAA